MEKTTVNRHPWPATIHFRWWFPCNETLNTFHFQNKHNWFTLNAHCTLHIDIIFVLWNLKKKKCAWNIFAKVTDTYTTERKRYEKETEQDFIHKVAAKKKSQTINYRDKCAREWSQIFPFIFTDVEIKRVMLVHIPMPIALKHQHQQQTFCSRK